MARNSRRRKGLLHRLLHSELAPGLVLIGCSLLAMLLANSSLAHTWHDLWHHALPLPPALLPPTPLDTLHGWINDGLMAIFFFVVGLEIKREILIGELSHADARRLPVVAALMGMAAPALVYLAIAGGDPMLHRGWAIPAATDIAFAVGVLALVGRGLPPSIRLFLLTVAIVDDLGAVVVIAVFYTAGLSLPWLGAGALILAALFALNRFGVKSLVPYLLGAVLLWLAVLQSGVHATVAGVLAALTVPLALDAHGDSPLLRLEHALVPVNGFVIVPLFGLANAGVSLGEAGGFGALPMAIAAGLLLGKQAGILLAVLGCEKAGIAVRPAGASIGQLWGMALLCGIGFTMSLFIAGLAFPADPHLVEQAKLGILAGSLLSALAGAVALKFSATKSIN